MFLLLFLIKKCFNFYLGCLFSQLNIFGGLEQIRGPVESTIFSLCFCYMLFNSYTHVVEHGFQPYGHICVVSHLS
jgi:hypothetical protein